MRSTSLADTAWIWFRSVRVNFFWAWARSGPRLSTTRQGIKPVTSSAERAEPGGLSLQPPFQPRREALARSCADIEGSRRRSTNSNPEIRLSLGDVQSLGGFLDRAARKAGDRPRAVRVPAESVIAVIQHRPWPSPINKVPKHDSSLSARRSLCRSRPIQGPFGGKFGGTERALLEDLHFRWPGCPRRTFGGIVMVTRAGPTSSSPLRALKSCGISAETVLGC